MVKFLKKKKTYLKTKRKKKSCLVFAKVSFTFIIMRRSRYICNASATIFAQFKREKNRRTIILEHQLRVAKRKGTIANTFMMLLYTVYFRRGDNHEWWEAMANTWWRKSVWWNVSVKNRIVVVAIFIFLKKYINEKGVIPILFY